MRPLSSSLAVAGALTLIVLALSGMSPQAHAQTAPAAAPAPAFKVWGSSRLRYDWIDSQARPGVNPDDDTISLRSILGVEWRHGPVRVGGELYDSRIWDADPGSAVSTNEVNTLELVQAWAALDIDNPLGAGGKATVQAGRFTLNLGSRRLVAADDYRNTTNGFTGVRADLKTGPNALTLIYVMPQIRLPDRIADILDNRRATDRANDELVLWGGLASRSLGPGAPLIEASYFHLEEKDGPGRATRNRSLDTFGGRLIRDPAPGRFDYEVEAFAQTGSIRVGVAPTTPEQNVSAGFVHADLGYTRADAWKTRVSVEYDRSSGDAPGGDYGRFDTLYGMRRADLGPAGLYNAIGRANIEALGLRIEATPNARLDGFVTVRGLWLAEPTDAFSTTGVRDATGASGDFAGTQFDGRVRHWLIPARARLEVNAVQLLKGRFLTDAPNAPRTGDTTYVSTALTLSF